MRYEAPKLERLGTLREITRAGGCTAMADGANPYHRYDPNYSRVVARLSRSRLRSRFMVNPHDIIHTHPTFGREHVTTGFECWCGPTIQTVCSECAHMKSARPDCWLCNGSGFIPVDDPIAHDGPFGLNVLHKVDYP